MSNRRSALLALAALALLWIAAPLRATAAIVLTGDTSRPEMSLFLPGEAVTLSFSATGLPAGDQTRQLLLRVVDEHETLVSEATLPVAADAQGSWQGSLPAPAPRLGFYRVYARLSTGEELPPLYSRPAGFLTYAVVPDPALRPLYSEQETYFGMQGGFSPKVQVLPYLGVRWGLGGFRWSDQEQDHSGQFAEAFAAAQAQGQPYPPRPFDWCRVTVNGQPQPWKVYVIPNFAGTPKWASQDPSFWQSALTPSGEKAYADYCTAAAKAFTAEYPDRTEHLYEIGWEPVYPWGFHGTDEDLIRYFQIAYGALHAADPKARVMGATGDGISSANVDWDVNLLQKGLGKYVDGWSIHPYHALPPEREGLISDVRRLKDAILRYTGKPLPMIGTEQGTAIANAPDTELAAARSLIRENLIMKGEGFRLNLAFYVADHDDPGGHQQYGYLYNLNPKIRFGTDKLGPKPVAPAFSALTFLLEGHSSAGAIEWLGDTAWGYAFERPGDVILAVWDYGEQPRHVVLPVGEKPVQVYDWMGNLLPLTAAGGNLALTLGPEPLYVRGVAPELWSSTARKPIQLTPSRVSASPGGKISVRASVGAWGREALAGHLLVTPEERLGLPPQRLPVSVPAGGRQDLTLSLTVPGGVPPGTYSVQVALQGASGLVAATGLVVQVEPPVALSSVQPTFSVAGQGLTVTLRDLQGGGQKGQLEARLTGVPGTLRAVDFTLPPGGSQGVTVPWGDLGLPPFRAYPAVVRVTTAAGFSLEQTFPVNFFAAPKLPAAPVIDGRLDDWAAVPALDLRGREAVIRQPQLYRGEADLSAKLRYAWDEKNLYFAYEVTDDTFVQDNTGGLTWKGDCLQLAFNLDPGKEATSTGNTVADLGSRPRYTEIEVALTSAGPQAYRGLTFDPDRFPAGLLTAAQLPLAVVKTPTGVIYEGAIHWPTLGADRAPVAGQVLGLAATVNDMDRSDQADPQALGLFDGIAGVKSPRRFGQLTLTGPPAPPPAPGLAAAPLTLAVDGYLGQSQPPGSAPVPFLGATGAVLDSRGRLWTTAGTEAFAFAPAPDGSWLCVQHASLPSAARDNLGLVGDGERAFFVGGDAKLYALDLTSGAATPVVAVPDKLAAFAVAPAGLAKGFAAAGKFFALVGNEVQAWDAAGQPLGVLLSLPPLDQDVHYSSLGLEPGSGDLLAGGGYPDMKIYRFTPAGAAVTTGGWPRPAINSKALLLQDGLAWALIQGGAAVSLPARLVRTSDAVTFGPYWTHPASGFARETGGGAWIASAQGLSHFPAAAPLADRRLGGLPGVRGLALGPDGTVLATVQAGSLCLRLGLDDAPSAPLRNNANEPWRVGAGWSGRAGGLAADGDTFLVLDETGKRLWRFDPTHTAWAEKPWAALTPANSLTAPRSLALGDTVAWILDGNSLLAAPLADLEHPAPVELPGADLAAVQFLAGSGDRLLAATGTRLAAYARTATGPYAPLWEGAVPLQKVAALAASRDYVAVADSGAQTLFLLDAADGKLRAQLAYAALPGGLAPTALALRGPWLLVADETGQRLVRLHVQGK